MSQQPDPVEGYLREIDAVPRLTAQEVKTFRLRKNRVRERRSLPPSRSAVAGSIPLLTRRV